LGKELIQPLRNPRRHLARNSLLPNRIEVGLFTYFVKIKSNRGEFFNEMADIGRWADKGRDTETERRWTSLRQHPRFTWTASGIAHHKTMSKVVKTQAHLMAASLQIPEDEHDNLTAKFVKREGNCRSDLGDHWKDRQISIRAKRRLLQSISFQFLCTANLKKCGWHARTSLYPLPETLIPFHPPSPLPNMPQNSSRTAARRSFTVLH